MDGSSPRGDDSITVPDVRGVTKPGVPSISAEALPTTNAKAIRISQQSRARSPLFGECRKKNSKSVYRIRAPCTAFAFLKWATICSMDFL